MSTVVSLHAHPDDEALLTGGTLAMLAADGHRVVLVVATAGERGLSGSAADLGSVRLAELEASADQLGCAELICLGYADSGLDGDGGFVEEDPLDVAERIAAIVRAEQAEILTSYDRAGGYGHPDHVRVYEIAEQVGRLTGVRVLQATLDRSLLLRLTRLLDRLRLLPGSFGPEHFATSYSAPGEITHEIRIGRAARRKREALRAHRSQQGGGDSVRTVRALGRLPLPLFKLVCGREWFVESGRPLTAARATSLF